MSLSIACRIVGDVAIVTCTGRLVEGEESAALDRQLSEVLTDYRFVVLNLSGRGDKDIGTVADALGVAL